MPWAPGGHAPLRLELAYKPPEPPRPWRLGRTLCGGGHLREGLDPLCLQPQLLTPSPRVPVGTPGMSSPHTLATDRVASHHRGRPPGAAQPDRRGEPPRAGPSPQKTWGGRRVPYKRSQWGAGKGDGEGAATSGGVSPREGRCQLPASTGRARAQQQERGSDGEGDEAVVALDVPLEDLGAGAQHALEAGPVQLHALEGPPGHHGGRPGPVQQQRDLPWGRERASGLRI